MSSPLLPNKWHLRKVADSASKACWICYKQTTSVLITPDNKDFFYICLGHLKDRGFCTPDSSEAAAIKEKKEKEDLEREKARIVAEYEERKKEREKRKKERKKEKEQKGDEKDKEKDKKDEEEEKKDNEGKEKKMKDLEKKSDEGADEVRIYELSRSFYQQRVDRIRNAQQAKRDRERLRNPNTFPSVPSGPPGAPP